MLDGPILAGLGGLPSGATEENEGRDGRHSWLRRGPLPSKRHHPGRSRGTCQGAYAQPSPLPRDEVEMLSYDIWGRWDSLGPVASMPSVTLWS